MSTRLAIFIVKSVLPAGVATIVGCATVGALALLSPGAAVILALCLILSGIVAPVITARAQRAAQVEGIQARAALSSSLVTLIDGYDELAINGSLTARAANLNAARTTLSLLAEEQLAPPLGLNSSIVHLWDLQSLEHSSLEFHPSRLKSSAPSLSRLLPSLPWPLSRPRLR